MHEAHLTICSKEAPLTNSATYGKQLCSGSVRSRGTLSEVSRTQLSYGAIKFCWLPPYSDKK